MPEYQAIGAVGKSIERFLNAAFAAEEPVGAGTPTTAALVQTDEFPISGALNALTLPALTIFLYRIEPNRATRASWSAAGAGDGFSHLALDLHYLLTPWADNAEHEHFVLGRTMQAIESFPSLSGPLLYPTADWGPNDSVQVVLADITTEEVMRTFDSLPVDFRISVPYVARVVRVDGRSHPQAPPVDTVYTGLTPDPHYVPEHAPA